MLLERKKRHRVSHDASWAVSYVDMLTLLLCFFIIFFNSKAITSEDESSVLTRVIHSISKSEVAGGSGSGLLTGKFNTASAGGTFATGNESTGSNLLEHIRFSFDKTVPAKITVVNKALIIDFENLSFFNSGSIQISPQGKESLQKIITDFAPYRNDIRITVQGYTDSTAVKKSRDHFSDNWQLSVLRATAVLKLFLKADFDQHALAAEGFADTLATPNQQSRNWDRKVTLKIEPRNSP